jgi:hypothetical protein
LSTNFQATLWGKALLKYIFENPFGMGANLIGKAPISDDVCHQEERYPSDLGREMWDRTTVLECVICSENNLQVRRELDRD